MNLNILIKHQGNKLEEQDNIPTHTSFTPVDQNVMSDDSSIHGDKSANMVDGKPETLRISKLASADVADSVFSPEFIDQSRHVSNGKPSLPQDSFQKMSGDCIFSPIECYSAPSLSNIKQSNGLLSLTDPNITAGTSSF